MALYRFDDLRVELPGPGISSRVVNGEGVQVIKLGLEAGHVFPPHQHHQEQILVILEGRLTTSFDDQVVTAGPGDVLHYPSNVLHGVTVLDEPVVALEIFSPPRSDLSHDNPR